MITTNFYNDLKEIKDAKDKLIKNLNATSDIKYDNSASMITLANGVLNRNNTLDVPSIDYTEDKDHYWEERPSWYPDTKALLNNAVEIIVNDTTYYPLYILLIDGVHAQDYFNKTMVTSGTTNVAYYNGSGGDAYLFSDTYDPLAENEGLEIGTAIVHKWDMSKDITDPTNLKSRRLRWVIVYGTSKTISKFGYSYNSSIYPFKLPVIEFITGDCTITATNYSNCAFRESTTLEYFCLQDSTKLTSNTFGYNGSSYSPINACSKLKSIILPEGLEIIVGGTSSGYAPFNGLYTLTYIKLPSTLKTLQNYVFYECRALPFLNIPQNCKTFSNIQFYGLRALKEIDVSMSEPTSTTASIQFTECHSLIRIKNGNNRLYLSNCQAVEYVENPIFSGLIQNSALRGSCVAYGTISYTNIENLITYNSSTEITYNPKLRTITFAANSGTVSGQLQYDGALENIYFTEGVSGISVSMNYNYSQIDYIKMPTSVNTSYTGASNVFTLAKYVELWNDFDLTYCLGSNTYAKSAEWFKDLCVWLKNNTGLTAKQLILGTNNLEIMKQIYLTYNPDNVNEITWVEQGTDGAINIVEYITGVKNWTLS